MEKCTQVRPGTGTGPELPRLEFFRTQQPAQVIKNAMDTRFGPPWHIVAGKYFAYEVSYEVRALGCCVVLGKSGEKLRTHCVRAVQTHAIPLRGGDHR